MTLSERLASLKESKRYVILLIVGFILLLLLAAIAGIALASIVILNYQRQAIPPPRELTENGPVSPPVPLSHLANDEAILKKRAELMELLNTIETTDYFETAIAPPAVNSNIKIE